MKNHQRWQKIKKCLIQLAFNLLFKAISKTWSISITIVLLPVKHYSITIYYIMMQVQFIFFYLFFLSDSICKIYIQYKCIFFVKSILLKTSALVNFLLCKRSVKYGRRNHPLWLSPCYRKGFNSIGCKNSKPYRAYRHCNFISNKI